MEITAIEFINSQDGSPNFFRVGNGSVIKIKEHSAQGEGDRWFHEVYFENGDTQMIFNVIRVYKTKEGK
jgi:hypothetical protein